MDELLIVLQLLNYKDHFSPFYISPSPNVKWGQRGRVTVEMPIWKGKEWEMHGPRWYTGRMIPCWRAGGSLVTALGPTLWIPRA